MIAIVVVATMMVTTPVVMVTIIRRRAPRGESPGEAEHRRQALQRVERRVSLTVLYQVDAILARSYDCSIGNCVSLSKAMFDSSRYRSNIFRAKASASISP